MLKKLKINLYVYIFITFLKLFEAVPHKTFIIDVISPIDLKSVQIKLTNLLKYILIYVIEYNLHNFSFSVFIFLLKRISKYSKHSLNILHGKSNTINALVF